MAAFDLRPLSLGEILDRTFTIYRRNFLLFVGIAGIPQLLILSLALIRLFVLAPGRRFAGAGSPAFAMGAVFAALATIIITILAYLFSQGGVIRAVTDLYLGRTTSIGQSLRGVQDELGTLFGVVSLNGLAVLASMILLVVPGLYVLGRLIVCVPAALTERLGPRDSLSRSWDLTKGAAGRAFMIFLLYFVIVMAASLLLAAPFGALSAAAGPRNPQLQMFWLAMTNVSNSAVSVLVSPILLIATAIFYFDLRVRKEAFDLQFMMNPDAERLSGRSSGMPSILS